MLKKSILLLTFLISISVSTFGFPFPKHEVRAVWLTTLNSLDWPSVKATNAETAERQRQQLCAILNRLQKANVNTVLLQTRVRGTTIYPSRYEPFDPCLTGKAGNDPGYDPLSFAISECHKRGMELHAWVVAIPVGKWNNIGCKRLRDRYPNLMHKIGEEGYMNPERSETGRYIATICREITERYDIDGIHLDYIRYPETWKLKVSRSAGREHITNIVREINKSVKSIKPWVKISCSPVGKFCSLTRYPSEGWNAYDKVCQDAQGWLREGLMDQLYPMMYFRDKNFYPFAVDWSRHSYGRTIAPGLGIWLLSSGKDGSNWPLSVITRELNVIRNLGMGHTYFRSRFFTDNTKGIYSYVSDTFDPYPSLIPPMTWQSSALPSPPKGMKLENEGDRLFISWWGGKDNSGGPYLMYNVYASKTTPVDTNDPRNLIALRVMSPYLTLSHDDGTHYFAVTSIDRYGNESAGLQSHRKESLKVEWLRCDGRELKLPPIDPTLNAHHLSIKSMAGNTMTIRTLGNNNLNVRTLPNGVYTINVVDRQKREHRIGQFMIKR